VHGLPGADLIPFRMSGIVLVCISVYGSVETRLTIKLKELPFEMSIKNINANKVCFYCLALLGWS
jgi:hypothetical protein